MFKKLKTAEILSGKRYKVKKKKKEEKIKAVN